MDAATRHVVERCPSCGVEHETPVEAVCEACHTPLRPWCRRHGRETGWLDAAACARCDEEAARPPRPARAPAPSTGASPPPPRRPAASAEPKPWPGRSPREILRGPPPRREYDGIGEPPRPPRYGLALVDALGLTLGGAVAGILVGPLAGAALGGEVAGAAKVGVVAMGLGGLVVGLIRVVALRQAERRGLD